MHWQSQRQAVKMDSLLLVPAPLLGLLLQALPPRPPPLLLLRLPQAAAGGLDSLTPQLGRPAVAAPSSAAAAA